MEAMTKVISRSSAWVPGKPEIPQRIQVVIQAVKADGKKLSTTKHLRYQGGAYVGRAYDYRKRQYVEIVFPLGILNGGLKEDVRLAA